MAKVLVTGAAGFIGFFVSRALLAREDDVVGVDNLNPYYDVALKADRLTRLSTRPRFKFQRVDLADRDATTSLFSTVQPELVVHLAAQAGVRYSLTNPAAYVDANLVGFGNVLEGCRKAGVRHLVFASSSSVYGANTKVPFSESDNVEHPISLYAATKKANELMAHTYSHLFQLPTTGLRFFTVYGPWGRPDMAYFKFTKAILAGEPIDLYNYGQMRRDFTYIDDVVEGVVRSLDTIPSATPNWDASSADPATSSAPFRIYNIGNNQPVELSRFVEVLEQTLGKTAQKNLVPIQPGDVPETYADISRLEAAVGYRPSTSIEDGLAKFVEWYRDYYKV
ncbi:MAG: NAD-dependent epimerase [Thermomicrobiales bacterium]